jgi:hypothetical protein
LVSLHAGGAVINSVGPQPNVFQVARRIAVLAGLIAWGVKAGIRGGQKGGLACASPAEP